MFRNTENQNFNIYRFNRRIMSMAFITGEEHMAVKLTISKNHFHH